MTLSIRNQFPGTVTAITNGAVMATVRARLTGGQEITAAITLDAVKELGLAEGSSVNALAKSTEIAIATAPVTGVSIRNQLPGTVVEVATGGAMATVKVAIEGGELTAAITKDAVEDLGLAAGTRVVALIKSTEIALSAA
ncbi:molybdopterin-binding protein [Kitasatospora sp. GAS204B]|uniref:TOBE domain-containing protein n=1 Tax=unclassified Kitasatospora TaxID=2633591 RepID=UPI002476C674|nr:TOBE domain-containing protein [Kitasatospora sp. GAS204B]MDH6118431.1 molybdate transport system regulatory protein [Kitasatospora sp. GAS204B]